MKRKKNTTKFNRICVDVKGSSQEKKPFSWEYTNNKRIGTSTLAMELTCDRQACRLCARTTRTEQMRKKNTQPTSIQMEIEAAVEWHTHTLSSLSCTLLLLVAPKCTITTIDSILLFIFRTFFLFSFLSVFIWHTRCFAFFSSFNFFFVIFRILSRKKHVYSGVLEIVFSTKNDILWFSDSSSFDFYIDMIHNWQPNTNTKPAVLQHKHTYTHICTHTESAYVSFNHDDGNGWHFKYPKKQQQKREIYSFFSLFSFNPSSIECVNSIEFNFIWKFHSFLFSIFDKNFC